MRRRSAGKKKTIARQTGKFAAKCISNSSRKQETRHGPTGRGRTRERGGKGAREREKGDGETKAPKEDGNEERQEGADEGVRRRGGTR